MEKEKQHHTELYNAIQRANATKDAEIKEVQKEIKKLK